MFYKDLRENLDAVASDKVKNNAYQDARDMVTLSIVSDLQHYDIQLAEVDKMLEQMYKMLGCTLTTIPGVNVITAVKILAEMVISNVSVMPINWHSLPGLHHFIYHPAVRGKI